MDSPCAVQQAQDLDASRARGVADAAGFASERAALVAVLAGGLGRRMGGAKASATLSGRPLIEYPLEAAREAGMEVVVVAKRASALPALDARVLYEPDEPRHPLCGILAALRARGRPVVAVACDMPFVNGALLAWLARGGDRRWDAGEQASHAARGDGDGEDGRCAGLAPRATVVRLEDRLQPLPALYCPADAPALARALAAERSLRATLAELAPRTIGADALARFGDPRRLLFSVNDARDLRVASEWMAR